MAITPRAVAITPDSLACGALVFPPAPAAAVVTLTFDFTSWLASAPFDVLAAADVEASPTVSLPAPATSAQRVSVLVGPLAPGLYTLGCGVLTTQGRQKAVTASLLITAT